MHELEVTVQVRNNRLKERRRALGLTLSQFAKVIGVSGGDYAHLEALRTSPYRSEKAQARTQRHEPWRGISRKLAAYYGVTCEELFPDSVLDVKNATIVRRLDGDDCRALMSANEQRMIEAPDVQHDREEKNALLRDMVRALPPRDAQVIRLRFGMDGEDEHPLSDVAVVMGLSVERVRQMEKRALRSMRRPAVSNKLRPFVPREENHYLPPMRHVSPPVTERVTTPPAPAPRPASAAPPARSRRTRP